MTYMATYNVTWNNSDQGSAGRLNTEYILWNMNAKLFPRRLPAIVFVGFLAIIGSIGNGLVVCIYRNHLQRSTVNVFIFWLAIFDFSLCFFEMPYKVFDLSFPLMYGYPIVCKGFGFLEIFLSMVSIILLQCIAFDRYFVVWRPLKRLTMGNINYIIILCVVLGLLFSWPTVIVYGEMRMKTSVPGVYSWGCGVAKEMIGSKFTTYWYYFLYFVFAVTCVILVTLYVRIWRAIHKWKYTAIGESMSAPGRRKLVEPSTSSGTIPPSPKVLSNVKSTIVPSTQENGTPFSSLQTGKQTPGSLSSVPQRIKKYMANVEIQAGRSQIADDQSDSNSSDERSSSGTATTARTAESCELGKLLNITEVPTARLVKHARMRRNTLIFGSIAAVFILSYLPILTIVFLRSAGLYNLKDAPLWQAQLAEVLHRSGYINNAVNPFIYGFLSPWFRVQVKKIFK